MKRRPQRGFTLVELMVVLALIAVLAMLATLSIESPGSPRTTSDRVAGMVQFARLRAEARQSIHKIRFESTQLVSVWESVMPDGVTPRTGFAAPVLYAQLETLTVGEGVVLWAALPTVVAPGANPAQNLNFPFEITVNPDGSSTSGTVYFSDTNTGADKHRIFVYQITGTALAREGW